MLPAVPRTTKFAGRQACRRPARAAPLLALLGAGLMLLPPQVASAQSLLQSLFGFGAPPPPRALPSPQTIPMRSAPHFYSAPGRDSAPRSDGGFSGSYRTVCVRMCDGYYFPVSYGVSRSAFTRDARACQSSCGGDARLFYQGTSENGAEGLVDLTGRAYSQIPNAFRYRKALVSGCACKPAPWSAAEVARHRRYALEAGQPVPTEPVAAAAARPLVAAAPGGVGDTAAGTHAAMPVARPASGEGIVATAESTAAQAVMTSARMRVQRPAATAQPRPLPAAVPAPPRPSPRAGSPAPAAAAVKSASAGAAKPVYSHDLGRFVFPGESRLR